MDDAQRMNQIMQMDTRALLSTIKDLESKLSQYQRQDLVPPWAAALMPRLDKLEENMRNSNIELTRQATMSIPGTDHEQTREEISRDDRLMSRVKAELHSHSESTSLVMEAKVASMNAEIERLHKLLQIRPTTSEYQKVMFIVNDQGSQMKHEMQDIQHRLMDIVHNSIAKEMGNIINGIKSNEGLNDRSIDGIMRRIVQISKDFYELKVSIHSDYEQLTAEQRVHTADIETIRTGVAASEAKIKSDFSRVHGILADHANAAAAASETVEALGSDLREQMHQLELRTKNDQNELLHDIRRLSDRVEFQIRDVKVYADSLQSQLEEHRIQGILKNNELASKICELSDSLDSNRAQQNQVLIMLEKLREFDATAKIAALTTRLDHTDMSLGALSARAEEICAHVGRVDTFSTDLKSEVYESSAHNSKRFDEIYAAMEECQHAIEVGSNDASILSDALIEVKDKVTDLMNLRAEVDYVKQINSGSIESVNALQERVESLDAMLKYVSETSSATEKKAQAAFEDLSSRVQDALIESRADTEARLEQMQEHMENTNSEIAARPSGGTSGGKARSKRRGSVSRSGSIRSVRSEEDSDEEGEGVSQRGRHDSSASSVGSRSKKARGRKKSVAYPIEGAPISLPSSPPEHAKSRPSGIGQVARQSSSRGVLLGAGAASRGSRMPITIIDKGETPPQSREGVRKHSELPPRSRGAAVVAAAVPIAALSDKEKCSGLIEGTSSLQQEFFDEKSGIQSEAVVSGVADSSEATTDGQLSGSTINVVIDEGPRDLSNNQVADSTQLLAHDLSAVHVEPQTNSAGTSGGFLGASVPVHDSVGAHQADDRRLSQDNSSLGGSESLPSDTANGKKGPIINPKTSGVSAASVSVYPAQPRPIVTGSAGAGSSSGYRYEPNSSSVTLQTNSLLQPKSRRSSGLSDDLPFEHQAVHDLLDVADRLFELGLHFEEVAVRRSLVPDISEESCSELAAISQTVGETVAKLVDTEAILRILRARPDQPIYGDAFIANRRLRLIDELLGETRKHLEATNPEAGITRLDARDYFMKKVEKVMQLSLSKHDQVLLPTQTRAGKVKIPSCIACDRPLLQKVRGDLVTRSEFAGRSQIVPFGSMNSLTEKDHFQSLDEGSFYGEQDSMMSKSADGMMLGAMQVKKVGLPSTLPRQPSRGGIASLQQPNLLDIGARGARQQEGPYTLMAGFKMPNKKLKSTKYSDDRYLFSGPVADNASQRSGQIDMSGSGAAGFLGSPNSKGSSK